MLSSMLSLCYHNLKLRLIGAQLQNLCCCAHDVISKTLFSSHGKKIKLRKCTYLASFSYD